MKKEDKVYLKAYEKEFGVVFDDDGDQIEGIIKDMRFIATHTLFEGLILLKTFSYDCDDSFIQSVVNIRKTLGIKDSKASIKEAEDILNQTKKSICEDCSKTMSAMMTEIKAKACIREIYPAIEF